MEAERNNDEKWVNRVTELIEDYRCLMTLRMVEHFSLAISLSIMVIILLVIIAVFILLFAGLGAAWWLGEYLDNIKAGFFIIGGFYTIIILAVLLTSQKIWIPRIRNMIIKTIYEQD